MRLDGFLGIAYNTTMGPCQIAIDTSVLIAGLRSRRGAAHRLLTLIDSGRFQVNISVPLILEYEETARRLSGEIPLTEADIEAVLDYICSVANHHEVFYLWRPFLKDPDDDMVLELAVTAECEYIVTYNERDLRGADAFGIKVVTPREFLQIIGALP
jgi:putative PIN family toxin of toxin-antitoxin system